MPVRAVLNAFMYSAQEALAKIDKISLVVFETFEVRERAARDGKTLKIAARKVSRIHLPVCIFQTLPNMNFL